MNKTTQCTIAGTVFCMSLATAAWADYAAAQKAYLQGAYSTALREFKVGKGARSLYRVGMMYDYGIGVPENSGGPQVVSSGGGARHGCSPAQDWRAV